MPQIDDIDRKIIAALQGDGRLSLLALSEIVGLSPSPCARRIRLLEESGVNGGAKPGHWGGVKPGQSGRGGGRSRSALFHSAVASERPSGFGVVVAGQTVPG